MYCRFCGTENSDENQYCKQCGKPMHEAVYMDTPLSSESDKSNPQASTIQAEWKKQVDDCWKENQSKLIAYNLIKAFGVFLIIAIPLFCMAFSNWSWFPILLIFVGSVILISSLITWVRSRMQPVELEYVRQKARDSGISAIDETPPGLRGRMLGAWLFVSLLLALLPLGVLSYHAQNALQQEKISAVGDATIAEAYAVFLDQMQIQYDIAASRLPTLATANISVGGKDSSAINIEATANIDTLLDGREEIRCMAKVLIVQDAPNGEYKCEISGETSDALQGLIRTEDDLCKSLHAFWLYYHSLSTEMQQTEFVKRMWGKTVHWSGEVQRVKDAGLIGDHMVSVSDAEGGFAHVYFGDEYKDKLLALNDGDAISFFGTFRGLTFWGGYDIKDAEFGS